MNAESQRLQESDGRRVYWKRWGPYLAERAWGTVREDYSADGSAWEFFPHDHARSRVYRWNEDGLAGICDDWQSLCLAFAFGNGRDPILKERVFGLTGHEGNHGEYAMDNVGPFDRSAPLPAGQVLAQLDGTGWMALYCLSVLEWPSSLAAEDDAY